MHLSLIPRCQQHAPGSTLLAWVAPIIVISVAVALWAGEPPPTTDPDTAASANRDPQDQSRDRKGAKLDPSQSRDPDGAAAPIEPGGATASMTAASQPAVAIPQPRARYDPKPLLKALLPALVAIGLAILTRQVVAALSIGLLAASIVTLVPAGDYNPIHWVTFGMDKYLFGVLAPLEADTATVDSSHLKILVFTLFIGAMVGVIEANGGTRAMVVRVTHRVRSRVMAQFWASVAGLVVFFDDYANAMIIGPSMRPVFDRLRVSRQKLAYIVDSTAAPVSSIFIGTWLAAEIGFLGEGIAAMKGQVPEFLEGMDASTAFWGSIPYRSYALLAIIMVFIISLTGRDFGSMRKAENDAAGQDAPAGAGATPPATTTEREADGRDWWLGAVPVLVLVGLTIALLFITGYQGCLDKGQAVSLSFGKLGASIKAVLSEAQSYPSLVYGSFTAAVVAVLTSVVSRRLTLAKAMDAVVAGMCRMFAACIVLVLAWGLSQAGQDLELGQHAKGYLEYHVAAGNFSVMWLPLAIFITSCVISFATGTSWGTMGILCPMVIPVAAGVYAHLPPDHALPLFYAAVGAVLAGAVFGDHCSPISDTTVLSSIATECDLTAHVRTQAPYAVLVAVVAMLSTDGLRYVVDRWLPAVYDSYWHWSWAYGLVVGTVLLLLFTFIFGRRPRPPTDLLSSTRA